MSLIIFDFDGTIVDSFEYVSGFLAAQAGRSHDLPKKELEQYRHLSMKDMALQLGVPFWKLPYVYFKGRRVMREHIMHLQPFDGMLDVIRSLHKEGHTLAIVSSNSGRNIKKFLKSQDLRDNFWAVRGGAGILGKVRLINQLKRRFKSDDIWYVGDEATDIVSSKAAGIKIVAVVWGFGGEETLKKFEPTALALQASDIPKFINA